MQKEGARSQYGASPSEMTPFAASSSNTDPRTHMMGGVRTTGQQQPKLGDPLLEAVAEEASPISSRPPAFANYLSHSAGNFDELLTATTGGGSGGLPDDDALGGDGGFAGGNRWPRQETLALLKIRSDVDAAFRDATLKGPLWEDVSRKLAEQGYKRSAKKCKEKFENVHKYYKRTKEGRAGRQDSKSYRFFSQLEALHSTVVSAPVSATPLSKTVVAAATSATTNMQVVAPVPVSIGGTANPMPVLVSVSSILATQPQAPPSIQVFPSDSRAVVMPGSAIAPIPAIIGVGFSYDNSSFSSESKDMEDDMDLDCNLEVGELANTQQHKRKRGSSKHRSSTSSQKMMEFFKGLMKQVMQKQEAMQKRFLEAIEKREQHRIIREEAWKRQEMARLAREHDLLAQERAISASRDAAIIGFLQKITSQTIHLPPAVTIHAAPPPPPPPPVPIPSPSPPPPPPPSSSQQYQKHQQPQPYQQQQQHQHHQQQHHQHQQLHHHQHPPSAEVARKHQPPISSEVVIANPEQQIVPQDTSGGGSFEATSSRWPKAEVLALINLRAGIECRYQEAGPKGPLWEEISVGMHQMGYKRSAKRCKEKWENINKYFKKVKESNKKRPEDAKTCPYFHQLDELYEKKILDSYDGNGCIMSSSSLGVNQNKAEELLQQQESMMTDPKFQRMCNVDTVMPLPQTTHNIESENKDIKGSSDIQSSNGGLAASLFREGSDGSGARRGAKKPEDIVKEQQLQMHQKLKNDFAKIEEPGNCNLEQAEDEDNDEEEEKEEEVVEEEYYDDDGAEAEKEMEMAYKIQFKKQKAGPSNGGGNKTSSFLAMVQ